MICKHGPFTFYSLEERGYLSITLTACDNQPWGWEWGWEDPMAGREPWLDVRLGKLVLFSFQGFKKGFELRLLGFWLIV